MTRSCLFFGLLLTSCVAASAGNCDPATDVCEGQDYQSVLQTQVGVKREHGIEEVVEDSSTEENSERTLLSQRMQDVNEEDEEEDDEDEEELVEIQEQKHFHALLYAIPIVLGNLTQGYGNVAAPPEIEMEGKLITTDDDKAYLLSKMDGFLNLMQDIMDDEDEICPKDDINAVKKCMQMAMCLVQSKVSTKDEMMKYALFEELYSRFTDIGWPHIEKKLGLVEEDSKEADAYMAPEEHSCSGMDWQHEGASSSLMETDESTSALAAAYRTSSALVAAAEATHAAVDAHAHNSSVDVTVAALHRAWEPACKLLECDSTNYRDLWRASHAHSMSLIEAGASAVHMQVHIRTRNKLEERMQRFLGEHGKGLHRKVHKGEASKFSNAPKRYFEQGRETYMNFAVNYPHKYSFDTVSYPLSLVDNKEMDAFFEAQNASELLGVVRSQDHLRLLAAAEMDDEVSDAEVNKLLEEQDNEDVNLDGAQLEDEDDLKKGDVAGRWGKAGKAVKKVTKTVTSGVSKGFKGLSKGLKDASVHVAKGIDVKKSWNTLKKGVLDKTADLANKAASWTDKMATSAWAHSWKGIQNLGDDLEWVGSQFTEAMKRVGEWIKQFLSCLLQFRDTWAGGYGMKIGGEVSPFVGVGMSIGASVSGPIEYILGVIKQLPAITLALSLSVVFGFVPGTALTGGIRAGIGVAGGVSFSTSGSVKGSITIGFTGAGLIPIEDPDTCLLGKQLPTPIGPAGCFMSYTVVLTTLCCEFNMLTGKRSCR